MTRQHKLLIFKFGNVIFTCIKIVFLIYFLYYYIKISENKKKLKKLFFLIKNTFEKQKQIFFKFNLYCLMLLPKISSQFYDHVRYHDDGY
jgi:hypothetical protein